MYKEVEELLNDIVKNIKSKKVKNIKEKTEELIISKIKKDLGGDST